MEPIVRIKNLSKIFRYDHTEIKALNNASLEINEGEVFGLLGPNGSGKTTMISILCGLIIPDSGTATVLGKDCVNDSQEVQKQINVVSGFSGVMPTLNCVEMLRYYCYLYGVKDSAGRIAEVIKLVDLSGREEEHPDVFSSGLRQRFMIAKSLLNKPKLLIMDEPTIGLDIDSANNVRKIITSLKNQGYTILLTTHNMPEAEQLCGRVAFISKGRIRHVGTLNELKSTLKKTTLEDLYHKVITYSMDE